ncbi:Ankyrin repeat [Dillenia turbinata]|uniref:Ankyrin repeat n=1 Tax=Dillenia turbinata TaxID=194707 RepID=A0AAN8Z498_9MAGN
MKKEEKEETEIECLDIQPDLRFYNAINRGDWEAIMNLLESKGDDKFSSAISPYGETILHVATLSGQVMLVKKLVEVMKPSDMEIKTIYGQTALSSAVNLGNTKIARYMVMQNPNLVTIANRWGDIPVLEAAFYGYKDMVKYLKSVTPDQCLDPETSTQGVDLLTCCIDVEFYDIALDLLQKFPQLAIRKNQYGTTALTKLVREPSAFKSGSEHVFWQRWIYHSLQVRIPGTSNNTRRDIESGCEGPKSRESMTQIALNRTLKCLWDVLKLFGNELILYFVQSILLYMVLLSSSLRP